MIAPLRARHRWASLLIGPLSLAGLGISLWVRPREWSAASARFASSTREGAQLQLGESAWSLLWSGDGQGGRKLELFAQEPSRAPDLWLYVAEQRAEDGESLPRGARSVGRASDSRSAAFVLEPAPTTPVWLYLYSLAWGEVVGVAELRPPH